MFDNLDLENIQLARLSPGKVWYNDDLKYLRTKIKNHFFLQDNAKCCYCNRLFVGEFTFVIDVEHILPQIPFDDLIFHPDNLNIACKRCNMNIKKGKVDFIVDQRLMGTDYFKSHHYKFIHPNLDIYEDHLKIQNYRNGNVILNKYVIRSNTKGQYTYDYFLLNKLEINTFYMSQGIKPIKTLSSNIKGYVRETLINLLNIL